MPFKVPYDWKIERLQEEGGDRIVYLSISIPTPDPLRPRVIISPFGDTMNATNLVAKLKNHGVAIPGDAKAIEVVQAIEAAAPIDTGLLATTTGWKDLNGALAYVLPNRVLSAKEVVAHPDPKLAVDGLAVRTSGTLATWQKEVARLARNSPQASLAIVASLAGCMLRFTGLSESMTVNFFGKSSGGKTTAILAAASAWGHPENIARWQATQTGLMHMAAANSDAAFILDDAERADLNPARRLAVVHEMIHVFASGTSRVVSRSMRDQLPNFQVRVIPLSTSPSSIRADALERRRLFTAGDAARLFEIPVSDGDVGGIWRPLDGSAPPADTAALSKKLTGAARLHFGTAGPALIRYIIRNRDEVAYHLARYSAKLELPLETVNAEVKGRIGDKVRFLYAAARLARRAGIIDWDKDWLKKVALFAYESVVSGAFPEDSIVPILESGFMSLVADEARFLPVKSIQKAAMSEDVVGLVVSAKDRIYAKREALIAALSSRSGLAINRSIERALLEGWLKAGFLLKGQGDTPTRTVIVGGQKVRMLEFVLSKRAPIS